MDRKKIYKIIPVEFEDFINGAYVLHSPDGEQYKITGGSLPTTKGSLIRFDKNTFLRLINDITIEDDLEEIVILNDDEDDTDKKQCGDMNLHNTKEPALWQERSIRILVEMYKKLKPLVDGGEIRTMKQMWEKINDNLKKNGYNYDAQQVENKWKGLVRSYRVGNRGSKRKSHYLTGSFEKEIDDILSKSKYGINSHKKDADTINVLAGPSDQKKIKLNEEIKSNDRNTNSNTEGINYYLCRIAKSIEVETYKRESAEERKFEQRERLIKTIEKGNELLSKLLQQK